MSEALLHVRGLGVEFSGAPRPTLLGLDFDVARGERVALVGESGAGKTVTALAMLGLLDARAKRSGSVLLGSRDLCELASHELTAVRGRRIGMIFQDPASALNPVLSIGSQLLEVLSLHAHGASNKQSARLGPTLEQQALDWLERVGLREPRAMYHRYPHELSGGMLQRVVIALALVGKPELLIADEPTTALDPTTQAEILALLLELQKALRMGILLITHDFGVVAHFAQRALLLHAGRIVESASVDDFFHAPAHPYTRALLASLPGKTPRGQPLPVLPKIVERGAADACSFATLCPEYYAPCSAQPALIQLNSTHAARCFRVGTR